MVDFNKSSWPKEFRQKNYVDPRDRKSGSWSKGLKIKETRNIYVHWFWYLKVAIDEGMDINWGKWCKWWDGYWEKLFRVKKLSDNTFHPVDASVEKKHLDLMVWEINCSVIYSENKMKGKVIFGFR